VSRTPNSTSTHLDGRAGGLWVEKPAIASPISLDADDEQEDGHDQGIVACQPLLKGSDDGGGLRIPFVDYARGDGLSVGPDRSHERIRKLRA